ncbi:hypothetical protein OUZ56_013964 [Daphnia magna]|uniref:Uncharacterized protein n=1 Tax=Daphnia magna TaxID=35525 RepID=A0ABQ9Z7H0_9CRUS|nr:hypothetical protein OUZ56_013964 [Daphnia magna]
MDHHAMCLDYIPLRKYRKSSTDEAVASRQSHPASCSNRVGIQTEPVLPTGVLYGQKIEGLG